MKSLCFIFLMIISMPDSALLAQTIDYERLSRELLLDLRNGKDTKAKQDQLAEVSITELNNQLSTDQLKLAFWINIYNAYIQIILGNDPDLYKDRNRFFKTRQIPIIQTKLAFSDIEHGIIRKSQYEYFLGYLSKFFPPDYEKMLRVEKRDYRIHFALNCGAKSCPPVAIYNASNLDYQLDQSSSMYLKKDSYIQKDENAIYLTQLFRWFSGDFGGVDGVRKILTHYKIIPQGSDIILKTHKYDWTLALGNYIDLE